MTATARVARVEGTLGAIVTRLTHRVRVSALTYLKGGGSTNCPLP